MSVSYKQFLNTDPLDNYEDEERYTKEWLPKVEKYREALKNAIPEEYKITEGDSVEELAKKGASAVKYMYDNKLLSEDDFKITDTPGHELLAAISLGKLTSETVFRAFARRAAIAHQLTNCGLEIFLDEGLERAKFLDAYYQKHGKTIGPLHGLPISVKEQINYRGRITHGGYVSKITHVPEEHGVTNQVLENLGAVFYIRTNQPQTLMHLDSNNNFIGLSRNPFNLLLSPGGSSSGEGALVGLGGSSVGIGSDIGGSIRGPAAFSGCFGLRPTSRRFSNRGGVSCGSGQESVLAVTGPLAKSAEDIDLLMKAYVNDGKPWELDGTLVPMPWREVEKPDIKSLTIGIMYDDGLVKPSPPIQRGVKEVAGKLKAAGANVVEFKPIRTKEAYDTVHKMYNCDGNYMQRKLLAASGEPLMKLTKWSLNYGDGSKPYEVKDNRVLNHIRDDLRTEYTKYMIEHEIDFLICPTNHNVAPKPEEVYNWSYTSLFNILDFPVLVFQTGLFQDPKIDVWGDDHKHYNYRSDLERLECQNYVPQDFNGAPIGLQLVGRRYFDEEVVAAGKSIVDLLGVNLYK